MRKIFKNILIFTAIILTLSGCVYKGTNDISLFIERYNSLSKKDESLDLLGTPIIPDESGNSFYFFLDNNFLLAVTESKESSLFSCSLCGEIENADSTLITYIFKKTVKSFCDLNYDEIDNIINELKINDQNSYSGNTKKSYEYKIYSYDFIVNSVGFYIGINILE